MEISKKDIIIRLLNQIYDLVDYNTNLKDKIKELEEQLKQYDKE
jgi:cell division septum initiation protein DivIVA